MLVAEAAIYMPLLPQTTRDSENVKTAATAAQPTCATTGSPCTHKDVYSEIRKGCKAAMPPGTALDGEKQETRQERQAVQMHLESLVDRQLCLK